MKGSIGRDIERVHVTQPEHDLRGRYLAVYLAAWSLFLFASYLCCSLAIGWSLVP